ncbi:MAG: nitroreductase/quinone reductase family protein [Thermoleophilia bacterium]
MEFGDKTVPATATEVTGAERDSLYAEQAELYPQFADYEKKTDRLIPVVVITPV